MILNRRRRETLAGPLAERLAGPLAELLDWGRRVLRRIYNVNFC